MVRRALVLVVVVLVLLLADLVPMLVLVWMVPLGCIVRRPVVFVRRRGLSCSGGASQADCNTICIEDDTRLPCRDTLSLIQEQGRVPERGNVPPQTGRRVAGVVPDPAGGWSDQDYGGLITCMMVKEVARE